VETIRREGAAGATVLRGIAGFGASSVLHSDKLLDISHDLPLVIEVVESRETIDRLLPLIDAMMTGGRMTLEKIMVREYGT